MSTLKNQKITQCELCAYFDEYEDECSINLEEDDVARYISEPYSSCPYFQQYDEYKVVRKQN